MKKIISIVVCLLMMFGCINISAENEISVEVDANILEFDTPPVNIDGRVLVPVRAIYEAMDATVLWDAENKTVMSILGKDTVKMTIDNNTIYVNGEERTIDVAPRIINDRTMIPARAAAEAFDAKVNWNQEKRLVEILSRDFSERIEAMKVHHSQKTFTLGESNVISDFCISYFDGYDARINANDGTDFEIVSESTSHYSLLTVRADAYRGFAQPLTEEYAERVSYDIVNLVAGTLISSEITRIGDTDFIKTHYLTSGVAGSVNDDLADVTVYTATKNGVVYTITCSSFGDVPKNISRDIKYMLNTILLK